MGVNDTTLCGVEPVHPPLVTACPTACALVPGHDSWHEMRSGERWLDPPAGDDTTDGRAMKMTVRTPEVHYVLDDGWMVRHTHDVDLATKLLQHHLLREERWSAADVRANITADNASPRWYRVTPCLPGSHGEGEGWAFQYTVAKPGGRGAFRVVEWWLG